MKCAELIEQTLEFHVRGAGHQQGNLSAASSRIQDYARFNFLVQSGTAMLAQANQLLQSELRLLQ